MYVHVPKQLHVHVPKQLHVHVLKQLHVCISKVHPQYLSLYAALVHQGQPSVPTVLTIASLVLMLASIEECLTSSEKTLLLQTEMKWRICLWNVTLQAGLIPMHKRCKRFRSLLRLEKIPCSFLTGSCKQNDSITHCLQ